MGKGNNNSIEGEGASEMIYDTKGINRSANQISADNTRAKSKRTNGHTA
jgi:hypothetical protein